jgi:phage terminase large subunit-like protein
VTQTPTPTATVTQTPTPTPTVKFPTVNPTVASTVSGYTMPQAQNIAAAFGIPALANVFYYGKEFGSKKQKVNEKGELVDEDYKPLSVTKAGAEGELMEEIAEEKKNKENNTNDALDLVLGQSSESMSFDDLLNIVKGA